MGRPRVEVLSGVVNGVNTLFTTPTPYMATSFVGIIDGQIKRADLDDGFIETNPALGLVTFKEAPLLDSVVQGFYVDTSPDIVFQEEIEGLAGYILDAEELTGLLRDREAFTAGVTELSELEATINDTESLVVGLFEIESITGQINEDT